MAGLLAGGSPEAPAPSAPFPLHWHFGQVFGEHQPGDEVQQGESGRLVGIPEQSTTTPARRTPGPDTLSPPVHPS